VVRGEASRGTKPREREDQASPHEKRQEYLSMDDNKIKGPLELTTRVSARTRLY